MNQTLRNVLLFIGALAIVGVILAFVNVDETKTLDLTTLATEIEQGNVKSLIIRGTEVDVILRDDTEAIVKKESGESLSELLNNYGVPSEKIRAIPIEVKEASGASYWARVIIPNLIPFILIFGLIWLFFRQVQGQNKNAMSFGQSKAKEMEKDTKNKETFKDVAGVKEAKEELTEIVEFLKIPAKFVALGAKIPKGVLLMGSPGTGKTLLARAVAGEAGVPFFHMSGSEFVEMLVGVGASRVRDLFDKAKKRAPCIVFIDEIDAVGRQRGSGLGGSHDEREQTLNQILVEMDGFEPNQGIIVMAATNRPDVLDPALLRPGRFDRRVILDLPDINDRESILEIHAKNKPLADGAELRALAERTPGFSGADLANLMNEAAILAARRDKKQIEMTDLLESIEKVMLGPERKGRVLQEDERKITAVHEAGHAIVAHLQKNTDPVRKISIISRGRAAGYTLKMPLLDKMMRRRQEYVEDIAVMLGGFAAEKIFFGDITTGASSDMQQVTNLARQMVTQWGMSETLGPRTYGEKDELIFLGREIHENRNYSEGVASKIDQEIDKLISNGLQKAQEIIQQNKEAVVKVSDELLVKETLEREEFYKVIGVPPANPKNLLSDPGTEERKN
ncbi:MAG: ATP-dependent zinc metalloprotease FtsH [Patescibacteria group bacterium]|nr:ATP-dependent zinc metalloprotease FtsH [Patescibacteria group bacterium]MBU2508953.1 ATP-dependent zinc metalloprotease FtsH [Patescibacteria group bacterium]